MLALVIAGLLLVLAWIAAWLLELPLWIPLLLTVVTLIGIAFVLVVRRILAQRKAGQIERALMAQAATAQDSMRPDLAAEIDSMTAEFHKAVAALKTSKLKGGGAGALYALPWYVIIGPPGAGKSTALRNSGLPFPYVPSQSRGSIKGIGGTRNCDWWLTNDAVLLDTAGRWTTQEDDQEWFAFLDLLKRHRPRQPLNGILVAVSVDDLVSTGDEGRVVLAARVRERIDEVMSRLGIALPVYVLVTKCDLVPGFVETFAELPRSERGQLWGYTLPFRELGLELAPTVDARFAELVQSARQRVMARIGHERRLETRELMAGFPSQLATLGEPLTHFLVELFQPNVYRQSPVLRGTYFTSGTQEGTPIDRLLGRLAEAANLPSHLALPEPVLEPKSYFLTKVFFDVLFPDAKLVAPTERSARRRQIVQVAAGLALCAMGGLVLVGSAVSWRLNREMVRDTAQLLRTVGEGTKEGEERPGPLAPSTLEALRGRADELRSYEAEGAPWLMRLGLYSGGPLVQPTTQAYARAMREGVVAPLVRREATAIDTWGRRFEQELDAQPSPEEHQRFYGALERHLRLTMPRAADEPAMSDTDRDRLVEALASLWAESSSEARDADRTMLARHARFYLELASESPALYVTRDDDAVRRARLALSRLPASQVALAELVRETEGRGYDLTLQRLIGATGAALSARAHVRGAFTRRAWDEHIRQRIDDAGARRAGAAWVLGPIRGDADERSRAMRDELRAQYFEAYVHEWQQFVRGLRTKTAHDETEALALLEDLTRGSPAPLGRLIIAIDHNLQLVEPEPPPAANGAAQGLLASLEQTVRGRVGNQAVDTARETLTDASPTPPAARLTGESVRNAFEGLVQFGVAEPVEGGTPPPVGLDVYQEQLVFLRDALATHRDDPSTGAQLVSRLQTARTRVQALISEQPVGWRPFFEQLLWPPIDGAATTSSESMAGSTARAWCSSVAVPFFSTLAGRYPFAAEGHDTAIADFAAFYRPASGTVWSFYEQSLTSQVERDGARYVFATRLGRDAGSVYRSTLPLFLERSQTITSAFFPPGATDPRVEMDVRVHPVPGAASVRFASGGTLIDYRNGPESWTRVVWPGERPDAGASIEVLGANGLQERVRQEGEWGLFRLMERAARIGGGGPGARTFTVTWHLPGHDLDVTIDVRLVRAENPFFAPDDRHGRVLGPMRAVGVQAPRVITARDGECTVGG
ncbi:type VI secretion system membrane subunit TssM [Sandaracinus amylolyticus]|uniref:type VI secretion system membrane subunit TssM n=1 Tax=Sandaracinus amylolyticus TaxID=927083 RepID=UPI001F466572|nr:type VI secretion system membrane subunit TssM [Sandaracinus amylolyticus]UJR78603.1 Type VI secretion system membrane subunit TssM [Sandaracinus amylolyticus]